MLKKILAQLFKTNENEEMNERLKRCTVNYPIGSKVIVKDNSMTPYKTGVIVDYYQLNSQSDVFPIIKIGEDRFVSMGIVRHSEEERNKALDKLNGIEQWNVMTEWAVISEPSRSHKK